MQHIGFIMDGNRRWAKKLGNLVKIGHENGGKKFEEVIFWSLEKHLSYISFWALSKENILERSTEELEGIFMVFRTMFPKLLALALERDVRLTSIGDIWLLPPDIRTSLIDAIEKTKNNTKMTVILAIAYSGQDEIIRGFRRAIAEGYDLSNLTEKDFLQFLDS
jgi:undecaprenyl diphosphate synthase